MRTVIHVISSDGPKMGSKKHPEVEFRTGALVATIQIPCFASEANVATMHLDSLNMGTIGSGFFRGNDLIIEDDYGHPFYSFFPDEVIREIEADDGFDYGVLPALLKALPDDYRCVIARLKD